MGLALAVGLIATMPGVAPAADGSRLAYAGNEAEAPALTPSMIEGLRRHYVALRKRAFDACREATGQVDRTRDRRCFEAVLERLIEAAGAPSLTQYHAYLNGIPRPVN